MLNLIKTIICMKKYVILPLLWFAICFCASCSLQETDFHENELYSEMVNYSQHYASICSDIDSKVSTKSADGGCPITEEIDIDLSNVNDKFIEYLDMYTSPENIMEWDEKEVLDLLEQDTSFTADEKLIFARSISLAYFVKTNTNLVLTKVYTIEDCEHAYTVATNRALRIALVELVLDLFEPTPIGELLTVVELCMALEFAEIDYVECMDNVRIPQPGYDMYGHPIE